MQSLVKQQVFAERRQRVIKAMAEHSLAIIPSAKKVSRNADVDYPFRQNSDFYYLTGFDEPDAVLVLISAATPVQILFCRDRDPLMEIWHGRRLGPEQAQQKYELDQTYVIDQFDKKMPELLAGIKHLYAAFANNSDLDKQINNWLQQLRGAVRQGTSLPLSMQQLDPILHEMRLFKDKAEIEVLRQAAEISAQAHIRAMQNCKPDMYEYQLEAELTYHFSRKGCRQAAYSSIVAGGANACILHYTENDQPLISGDLVLIDAGAELDYYAGDITRTFPVNGKFSEPQAKLYQLVLSVQEACIAAVAPGKTWQDIHDLSVRLITKGLLELGLLKGTLDMLIAEEAYKDFYMHRIGHWLGMDVHDVGAYKVEQQWRPFAANMLLTIEPGIYVAPDNTDVDECWRGIGIRIEEDVLVTKQGAEVLTESVPKQIDAIEALMAR